MTKLTIAKIGSEKTINYTNKKNGQPDSFKKIGFQTNEYGDRWFDVSFRGEVPVKVGQSYEFEIKEREYNGKTYYDAELPRQARSGGGMNAEQYASIMRELQAINANILRVWGAVRPEEMSNGSKVPDFSEVEERKQEIAQAKAAPALSPEELESLDEVFNQQF